MLLWSSLAVLSLSVASIRSQQQIIENERFVDDDASTSSSYVFRHKIERVAVIGAGPTGLQHAAALIEHGFQVRLFERAPQPGGQWLYTEKAPVPAPFPNRPIETAGFVPDIPDTLPLTRYYTDGEEGLSLDWRIREQWHPAAIWRGMPTSLPPFLLTLPGIQYPPDTPWRFNNRLLQRHVRQYASSKGLNSNDEESANIASYSTRVERVQKLPGASQWTLTLRKIGNVPQEDGRLRVDWWTEMFDAVAVATHAENDAPWVPDIPGLKEWAEAFPEEVYHGQGYRRPEPLEGKKVLIVGGSLSGGGIAADLISIADSVTISVHQNQSQTLPAISGEALRPENATIVHEIERFANLPTDNNPHGGVKGAAVQLANGTVLSGFDHIILATGYRVSHPFLWDYQNSTIVGKNEPEVRIPPIVTDGTHLRSLHWTGHYIPDPTLAVANTEPWDMGRYTSLGLAKVWSGKARLPSTEAMWKAYPGAGRDHQIGPHRMRLFVSWLNDASLEFGGRLVVPYNQLDHIGTDYYFHKVYKHDFDFVGISRKAENTPRKDWPTWNQTESELEFVSSARGDEDEREEERHWAAWNDKW